MELCIIAVSSLLDFDLLNNVSPRFVPARIFFTLRHVSCEVYDYTIFVIACACTFTLCLCMLLTAAVDNLLISLPTPR